MQEKNKDCQTYPSSIFTQPWWLDAVAPGQWGEVVVEHDGTLFARMPYVIKKKAGFRIMTMPKLTQKLGPWLRSYPGKKANKFSEEKQLMDELIERLPPFDYFIQHFDYSIRNWLPFYWNGFEQTTKYTYVIEDLTDLDKIFNSFSHAKRKNIRKAEKLVTVKEDLSAQKFYQNHKYTLSKQNQKISYSFDLFNRLYNATYSRQSGKIFYCIDKYDNIHSAIFVIWDADSAYFLISSIDRDFSSSGSATLLIWEAIKYVQDKTNKFDFEGSMIKNVEESFRSFGGNRKEYYCISKINSLGIRIYQNLLSYKDLIFNK